MTTTEIEARFDLEYDDLASFGAPGIETSEKSNLINIAMEQTIVNYYGNKSNYHREGFEETEKRTEDLGTIVRYKTISAFVPGFLPNTQAFQLPNTLVDLNGSPENPGNIPAGPTNYNDIFWFNIYEACEINTLNCDGVPKNPKVISVTHQELDNLLRDPFNKPDPNRYVFRLRSESRTVSLMTVPGFQVTNYTYGYIRKPVPVDLSVFSPNGMPDIADYLQREIITRAVSIATDINRNIQKVQINKAKLQTVE